MKKKIFRHHIGIVHQIGVCNDCEKQFDLMGGEKYKMLKHIKETGHSVAVESSSHCTYILSEK